MLVVWEEGVSTRQNVPTLLFLLNRIKMEEAILKQLADIRSYSLLAAKNVLSIDDVALLTGLSKSYVYKLTCRKEIPYYKPNGKLIYFDRQEIENWMRRNKVNSVDEAEQVAAKYLLEKGGKA